MSNERAESADEPWRNARTGGRPRSAWALVGCGGLTLAAFLVLAWQSHRTPSVWTLLFALLVAWAALLVAWRAAGQLTASQILASLWIIAVGARLMGVFSAPVFEDDWYRYLWDGRQFVLTGNPYDVPPRASFIDASIPDAFQEILNHLNYPDVPTIYGPVCQYVFALSYWMAPGQLWPLKLMLVAADLLALWLLLRLTSPRNALLYAWCPLVIFETAFNAHVEMLGVALIVAALWARQRFEVSPGRAFTARALLPVLCTCAVAARIHAVLLVPFLLWPLRWRKVLTFVLALALIYAPFWLRGSAADFAGLKAFLGEWEFNSSLFGIVKGLMGWDAAKVIGTALFVGTAATLFLRFCQQRRGGASDGTCPTTIAGYALIVFGAFFLCSAVVNPWYLLWLAPFVALRPSFVALVAMAAVSLSYIHGGTLDALGLPPYEHPKWLRPLEYGLILAAACFQWRRNLFAADRNAD